MSGRDAGFRSGRSRDAGRTKQANPLILDADGSAVVDGVVRLTCEAFRDVLGYRPMAFGMDGDFNPASFPAPLTVIDASDCGTLFAADAVHPGARVAVLQEAGLETVNLFVQPPNTEMMIAAHWVEAELALATLRLTSSRAPNATPPRGGHPRARRPRRTDGRS